MFSLWSGSVGGKEQRQLISDVLAKLRAQLSLYLVSKTVSCPLLCGSVFGRRQVRLPSDEVTEFQLSLQK